MRGKGSVVFAFRYQSGITPAHAGKRSASSPLPFYPWDHPRPCGEKFTLREYPPPGNKDHPRPCGEKSRRAARLVRVQGSPPPMRGKGSPPGTFCAGAGITPAHAGKSKSDALSCLYLRDHPRPCGEKCRAGTLLALRFGITPAHAGKSLRSSALFRVRRDHPRPCGEKGFTPSG